jgi:hypothetical protein
MSRRLQGIPVFAARDDAVPARLYNLWRRARMRRALPLRLRLPGLKEMGLILDPDAWIVVDGNRSDVPVLAWVHFQDRHRDALHTPVPCTLHYYHFMASGLRGEVLALMEKELERQLRRLRVPIGDL